MNRRGFLGGIAGILAGGMAPAIGHAGILMPVKKIVLPETPLMWNTRSGGWQSMKFPGDITDLQPIGDLLIVTAGGRKYCVSLGDGLARASPILHS